MTRAGGECSRLLEMALFASSLRRKLTSVAEARPFVADRPPSPRPVGACRRAASVSAGGHGPTTASPATAARLAPIPWSSRESRLRRSSPAPGLEHEVFRNARLAPARGVIRPLLRQIQPPGYWQARMAIGQ